MKRRTLFSKYLSVLLLLVGGVLIVSSLTEFSISYDETKRQIVALEREKAVAAAHRIEQFVLSVEQELRSTLYPTPVDQSVTAAIARQREMDFLRLLRNVSAITDIWHLDIAGKERLSVSRVALDTVDSGKDFSEAPEFQVTLAKKRYFSPVYFRDESEPYMALAVALDESDPEVTVAAVNLKAIWEVVSRIRVGAASYAYVADSEGRLIAHPDISMVLQKRDLSQTRQVQDARAHAANGREEDLPFTIAKGLQGGEVLAVHAPITQLGWFVFIEQPLGEVLVPLRNQIIRSGIVVLFGLALAVLSSIVLARRMVAPVRRLQESAAHVGRGELDHRIDMRTGDELEALAEEFNRTTARLQDSQRNLEQKVEARTAELTRSLEEMRALAEVGRAVSSTLDLQTVLKTIITHAVQLSNADAGGTIYEFDQASQVFEPRASYGVSDRMVEALRVARLRLGESTVGICAARRAPYQIPDIEQEPDYRIRGLQLREGARAVLGVPLLREDQVIGALVIRRRVAGEFSASVVSLLQTFAGQSVLAIQNARLFHEIREKSRQLEAASRHKSDFLSSMSHELRTPLNAILGFNELILGKVYGEVPAELQEPLADMQASGRHLLRLINNVLDLAKIEAGRMELSLASYSVQDVVQNARATLRPLAADKGLELTAAVPPDLPLAYGDAGRIAQCLMNLAGNAIKFTKSGQVDIAVERKDGTLSFRVADTGMGIAPDKIGSLFTEFKQTDATIASEYGGTGLGLSITRKFIELHGGRIWVESELGKGSTFFFEIPLRASAGRHP